MNSLLADVGLYFWRLLPANPILVRVVFAASKRMRHLWARLGYLLALVAVFLIGGGLAPAGERSLADLAKQASQTFAAVSVVQLLLMCFVAPVFCAGAITQEKDANTFHILLTTPLSNGQIVLGSLFSRLYFVWALLLSGLPIFCITMIYGGVTMREIFESFGLAACTGLLAGSLAIFIAFSRLGTRRTIFAFFVGIAVYLVGVYAIGASPVGILPDAPTPYADTMGGIAPPRMSWLAPLHPFLALLVVTGQNPAPGADEMGRLGWPANWLMAHPQYGYMTITSLASVALIGFSLLQVRRAGVEADPGFVGALLKRLRLAGEPRPRRSRTVWRNPIAWREAATRGSAAGRSALRVIVAVCSVVGGVALVLGHAQGSWGLGAASINTTRLWLTWLVWMQLIVILLVVTSTAATTLTRQKESQTLEILISTPLTSRYILAGMLQGLVRLVVPLMIAPALTVLLFNVVDLVRGAAVPVAPIEATLALPALMTAFAAVGAVVGMQFSLTLKSSTQAVMVSTAVVIGGAALLWGCGAAVTEVGGVLASVLLPFSPLPAMQAILDPWRLADASRANQWSGPGPSAAEIRATTAFATLLAVGAYAGITVALYSQMVKSFDMTVRKQAT